MKTFIEKNYQQFKAQMKSYCKSNCLEFDEDIFRDTLLTCMEKVTDESFFGNYLFIAFKTNLFREKQYHRNSMRGEMPENYEYDVNNTESYIEWNNLQEVLIKKFGQELVDLFNKRLSGYTIKELEDESHITGLNYRFKKIMGYCEQIS